MGRELFNGKYEEILKALDKHLRDNVIIHHESQFEKTEGPSTNSAATVVFRESENSGTKFVKKRQSLEETITEVIAGSLYKALLYDKSPNFTLCERSDEADILSLKSNFLKNFVTLAEFMDDKKKGKRLDLIYEKLASENGQKELTMYMSAVFYSIRIFKEDIEYISKKIKGSEEFFASILKQLDDKDEKTKIGRFPEFQDILIQILERFKDDRKCMVLFDFDLSKGIEAIISDKKYIQKYLQSILSNLCDKDYQDEAKITNMKSYIRQCTLPYCSLNTIADRLNRGEFNKKLLIEMLEEIEGKAKKAEEIKEQLNNYANQELKREVVGLEKIIASMMLLGYYDLHGSNIGVMEIEMAAKQQKKYMQR